MEKVLVVWRRFGKEHGENTGFKINPTEVVDKHIKEKVAFYNGTDPNDWR